MTEYKNIMEVPSIESLKHDLHTKGCTRCNLGFQKGLIGCCVSRGDHSKRRMLIGEAPGRFEDAQSEPFVGPAGKLLDKIFAAVDWDTNKDWYLTNVVLCRPIAEKGSGKENLTPRSTQKARCRPFLDRQIELIQPRIIVTIGGVATQALLKVGSMRMGDYRGRLLDVNGTKVFPMIHPAAILHAQSQPDKWQLYREQTWEDIQKLRQIVDALEGE